MSNGFRIRCDVAAATAALALAVFTAGCGGDSSEIRDQRVVEGASGGPAQSAAVSTGERFGYQRVAQTASQQGGPQYAWNAPDGWEELPPEPMRPANFRAGSDGEVEVYLSVLSGDGGGVAANVNRWREQMGLDPLEEEAVEDLPTRDVLGQEAVLLDLEGRYEGMGSGEALENARLLGAILEQGDNAVFVKMAGPAEAVAEEEEAFSAFLGSLDDASDATGHGGHGHGVGDDWSHPPIAGEDSDWEHPPMAGGADAMSDTAFQSERPSGLEWQAPEGWSKGADRPVRLVTYTAGPADEVECYVTILSGNAGGVEMNVNRWRQEMGEPPLGGMGLAGLPEVEVLGQAAKLVEAEGDYAGKTGEQMESAKMLGVIAPLDDQVVFVRMTGPRDAVRAERDNFIRFCESLQFAGTPD